MIMDVHGDPKFYPQIKDRDQEKKTKFNITIDQSFAKVQEYFLTRRDIWFISQAQWDVAKVKNSVLDYYIQFELTNTWEMVLVV